jgi:hypothetical protein
MGRVVFRLAALAGALCLSAIDSNACGDKFLNVGRGVRYERAHAASRPASVLLYAVPGSRAAAAAKQMRLEWSLKQAGHHVQRVSDAAGLDAALRAGDYDLVVADPGDSVVLRDRLGAKAMRPVVLPLVYRPTQAELATAERDFGPVLEVPGRDPLSVVDAAITRAKGATK